MTQLEKESFEEQKSNWSTSLTLLKPQLKQSPQSVDVPGLVQTRADDTLRVVQGLAMSSRINRLP